MNKNTDYINILKDWRLRLVADNLTDLIIVCDRFIDKLEGNKVWLSVLCIYELEYAGK
jgi:hypothetical protein